MIAVALIILTVCDRNLNISYDVEVPDDLETDKLLDDLIQTLKGADPTLDWNQDAASLSSVKLGRRLSPQKTLKAEGIWNGDYLYIEEQM